jgi:flagellar biosynthesis component FlhA
LILVAKGLWAFFTGTPIGRALVIALAMLVALFAYTSAVTHQAKQQATAAVVRKVEKATDKEADRRDKVLEKSQHEAEAAQRRIVALEKRNKELMDEINDASRAHDGDACLGPDSLRRLNALSPR